MPRPSVVYEVLIASPSDVRTERAILAEVIDDWNSTHSRDRGASLKALRWELDGVPGSGARPQDILNRQLVENADILIGVFWTRLGTPTGHAVSGTAEEIDHFRSRGKPALLYFSEADIPHDHDPEQLRRLKEYRKTLEADTLYQTYRGGEDLRRRVTRDLARTINDLTTAGTYQEVKPAVTQNDSVGLSLQTQTQYMSVGSANPLKVVRVIGSIENRSTVRRLAEYSCTLLVPECCLTFNNAMYPAEIKPGEAGYRKFRHTERNHAAVSIHPGDRFQVISVEIAVGHLSSEDQTKCLRQDLIAEAVVDGHVFRERKTISELIGGSERDRASGPPATQAPMHTSGEARGFKTIQTNPKMFSKLLPVHTVTDIDRTAGIVTLNGSDGSSHQVRLDSWGPYFEAQPSVGSQVQLLP